MKGILSRLPVLLLLLALMPQVSSVHAMPRAAVHVVYSVVRPGERQVVEVSNLPVGMFAVRVTMPNGSTRNLRRGVVTGDVQRFTFRQPANVLSRKGRIARVQVWVKDKTKPVSATSYRIAFAPIEIVIPGTPVTENSNVAIWVHAGPRAPVALGVHGSYYRDVMGSTGRGGWFRSLFQASNPTPSAITTHVTVQVPGTALHTSAKFTVQPFPFRYDIGALQVLHLRNGAWAPTTSVEAGEEFRVVGIGSVLEPAGNYVTAVPGTVSLHRSDMPVASQSLQSISPSAEPYFNEYASFRLPENFAIGSLEIVVDIPPYLKTANHTIYRLSISVASGAHVG